MKGLVQRAKGWAYAIGAFITNLARDNSASEQRIKPVPEPVFLEMYRIAHNNAADLLTEAELLFENRKYERAYFLAFTGLEEIAKSQLAADVYTGLIEQSEFWKSFRDHEKKIGRMAWASEDAEDYLDLGHETYLDIEPPNTSRRMNALYARFEGEKVKGPGDHITQDNARAIVHTLRVAIDQIILMTEYYGHQIGTKGFMK
jgi:AbiV family abortive infection protein